MICITLKQYAWIIKFSAWIIYKTFLHIYTVPKVKEMFFLFNTPIYFPLLDSTYIYILILARALASVIGHPHYNFLNPMLTYNSLDEHVFFCWSPGQV